MMKLACLTTAYGSYLRDFYARRPGLAQDTHAKQKAALDFDAFGWADFWSHALTPLGYDVMEVVANARPLQQRWSLENGIRYNPDNWLLDVAAAQIKYFQPAVLFVVDYSVFSPEWIAELKRTCPSIRLTIGWCGAPYRDPGVFCAYDLVLSCIPELVTRFRSMGHRAAHLNHAFDPRILDRLAESETDRIPFSFIGSLISADEFHRERVRILEQVVDQIPTEIFTPNMPNTKDYVNSAVSTLLYDLAQRLKHFRILQHAFSGIPFLGKAMSWKTRPHFSMPSKKLRSHARPPVYGLEMFQTLRSSHLTFNSHIDISSASASNMRLFEATGVGTCLVTDWKGNLGDLFEPDVEVVTYRSPGECAEKVKWLLDHPRHKDQIALAGQRKTLSTHTFSQRAEKLDGLIKKWL